MVNVRGNAQDVNRVAGGNPQLSLGGFTVSTGAANLFSGMASALADKFVDAQVAKATEQGAIDQEGSETQVGNTAIPTAAQRAYNAAGEQVFLLQKQREIDEYFNQAEREILTLPLDADPMEWLSSFEERTNLASQSWTEGAQSATAQRISAYSERLIGSKTNQFFNAAYQKKMKLAADEFNLSFNDNLRSIDVLISNPTAITSADGKQEVLNKIELGNQMIQDQVSNGLITQQEADIRKRDLQFEAVKADFALLYFENALPNNSVDELKRNIISPPAGDILNNYTLEERIELVQYIDRLDKNREAIEKREMAEMDRELEIYRQELSLFGKARVDDAQLDQALQDRYPDPEDYKIAKQDMDIAKAIGTNFVTLLSTPFTEWDSFINDTINTTKYPDLMPEGIEKAKLLLRTQASETLKRLNSPDGADVIVEALGKMGIDDTPINRANFFFVQGNLLSTGISPRLFTGEELDPLIQTFQIASRENPEQAFAFLKTGINQLLGDIEGAYDRDKVQTIIWRQLEERGMPPLAALMASGQNIQTVIANSQAATEDSIKSGVSLLGINKEDRIKTVAANLTDIMGVISVSRDNVAYAEQSYALAESIVNGAIVASRGNINNFETLLTKSVEDLNNNVLITKYNNVAIAKTQFNSNPTDYNLLNNALNNKDSTLLLMDKIRPEIEARMGEFTDEEWGQLRENLRFQSDESGMGMIITNADGTSVLAGEEAIFIDENGNGVPNIIRVSFEDTLNILKGNDYLAAQVAKSREYTEQRRRARRGTRGTRGTGERSDALKGVSTGELRLIDAISMAEGTTNTYRRQPGATSDYDIEIGYGRHRAAIRPELRNKPLTEMTISEVYNYQDDLKKDPNNRYDNGAGRMLPSSAVGRWQFIEGTLREYVEKAGFDPNTTKFTADVQDKLFITMLEEVGLSDYRAGKISKEQLMDKISKKWVSLPDSRGQSSTKQGLGMSFAEWKRIIDNL